MAKKRIGTLFFTSIIILLPMAVGFVLWNRLPETIPFHWNLVGEIGYHAPKIVAVVGFPALMLVLHWISQLFKYEDRRNEWVLPVLTLIVSAVVYYAALI